MFITTEEYYEYEDSLMGYCNSCDDFTRSRTEPDAEGYDCPVCENSSSVCGTMNALMSGGVEIE